MTFLFDDNEETDGKVKRELLELIVFHDSVKRMHLWEMGARQHRTATKHRTTPHHTAPHHTAPHCTAPHRTAPHRTALHRLHRPH
jgi:hypothetical protein